MDRYGHGRTFLSSHPRHGHPFHQDNPGSEDGPEHLDPDPHDQDIINLAELTFPFLDFGIENLLLFGQGVMIDLKQEIFKVPGKEFFAA